MLFKAVDVIVIGFGIEPVELSKPQRADLSLELRLLVGMLREVRRHGGKLSVALGVAKIAGCLLFLLGSERIGKEGGEGQISGPPH